MAELTIKDIKDAVQNISIQHIEVKGFDYGESWESSVGGDGSDHYPKIYFEVPVLGQIDIKRKQYSFGLVCFIYPKEVYVKYDHFESISWAQSILEQIILKLEQDYKGRLSIERPYSTLTFQTQTTSMLDGARADLNITVIHQGCVDESKFDFNRSVAL